jgi:hypothetical protein
MQKGSSLVFELIKSLNKEEKRFFSQISDTNANYRRLFDALQSLETFDEDALKKRLVDAPAVKRHLPFYKNYLYHALLDALCDFHKEERPQGILHKSLQKIDILFKKDLLQGVQKLIQKMLPIAEQYQLYDIWQKLLYHQYTIWNRTGNGLYLVQNCFNCVEKIRQLSILEGLKQHAFICQFMLNKMLNNALHFTKQNQQSITVLLQTLQNIEQQAQGQFSILCWVYKGLARARVLFPPFYSDTDYDALLLALYEQSPQFIDENKSGYYAVLSNALTHEIYLPTNEKKKIRLAELMENFPFNSSGTHDALLQKNRHIELLQFHIAWACQRRDYSSAYQYAQAIEQLFSDPHYQTHRRFFPFLYVDVARAYFWQKNLSAAVDYLQHAYEIYQSANKPPLEYSYMLLWLFVTRYELGHHKLLHSLLKTHRSFFKVFFGENSFEFFLILQLRYPTPKKITAPPINQQRAGYADRLDFWYWWQEKSNATPK